MENNTKNAPRRRSPPTPQFTAERFEDRQPGGNPARSAVDLRLTETAVQEWVKQSAHDDQVRADYHGPDRAGRTGQGAAGGPAHHHTSGGSFAWKTS